MALPSGEATDAVNNLSASSPSLPSSEGPPEPSGVTARSGSPGMFAGLLGQSINTGPMAALRPVTGGVDLGLGDDLDFQLPVPSARAAPTKPPQPADKPVSGPTPRAPTPSPTRVAAPSSPDISDDALSAMEAAFDEMASRPQVRPTHAGLTDEERSFLSEPPVAAAPPVRPVSVPPRPAAKPGPRPRTAATPVAMSPSRLSRAPAAPVPAVRELGLSAEARQAAFLSSAPAKSKPPSVAPRALVEATLPEATIKPMATRGRELVEMEPVVAAPVGLWSGLRVAACIGIAVVGVVVGAALGAVSAPKAEQDSTPHGRAMINLADGNRYFDQQRYDDALGQYKAALSLDKTLAEGHRAKGSALAKLGRHDEAADAYAEYLLLAPTSADAADFKAAIARHRPEGAK
jgi:hypothetical protein